MLFIDKYFRFKNSINDLIVRISLIRSRGIARRNRRQWVKNNGKSVMNRQIKKAIKAYSRERFGSTAFWPYLALYTEMRSEFIKGWIPDDYYRYFMEPKLNPPVYSNLSEQKTYDYQIWGDFAVRPLFSCISGRYYNTDLKAIDHDELKNSLNEYNDIIVIKEEFTMGGKSVQVIHSSEFTFKNLMKGRSYVIQPYIKQHKVINDLYPDSVNTIRVTTYMDKKGVVVVKSVILRFGIDGSRVDNLSSGGQFLYFDESGFPYKYAYDMFGNKVGESHKNTGYVFSEMKIPMLDEVKEKCIRAHEKYPYVRIVGWDVCITESGEPKLIEWNAMRPGILPEDILFGPFWGEVEV